MAEVRLRGMTWDHARGFDPMVATSVAYAARYPGVTISWEKRSLQAFADRPIGEMAQGYDLMVIDHPHVGEVARAGHLVDFNTVGRNAEVAAIAAGTVGASHPSYAFDGGQWGLAIDAATPVACYRPDLLDAAPARWDQVLELARAGRVGFALIPINALMTFFGMARNRGYAIAEDPERLIAQEEGAETLEILCEIVSLIDPRCLTLDPIGIYEWMGRSVEAPAYSPFGYGYTNYSRDGYCRFPLVFANAPGVGGNGPRGTVLGGTGIAISAACAAPEVAVDYALWIAGADCQKGLYFESGGQPGHAAAWEDEACNAACRDFMKNTRVTLETAWVRPRYDGYMAFQDRGGDIVHACLRGDVGVRETLDRLDAAYRESRG
ncbi:ABC transporter substrate-binding protein [Tropicimonas sp.]|uniref:ABC transporter substrate-binding protein n=1 Tax=Tropicimonas sp. TaxID=2067044 RepID=UPI003A86CD16